MRANKLAKKVERARKHVRKKLRLAEKAAVMAANSDHASSVAELELVRTRADQNRAEQYLGTVTGVERQAAKVELQKTVKAFKVADKTAVLIRGRLLKNKRSANETTQAFTRAVDAVVALEKSFSSAYMLANDGGRCPVEQDYMCKEAHQQLDHSHALQSAAELQLRHFKSMHEVPNSHMESYPPLCLVRA